MEEEFCELQKQQGFFSQMGETVNDWEDIYTDSPDNGVDSYPSKQSPTEVITPYNTVNQRAANSFGV